MTGPINLKPFDEEDWFAFAGCDSKNPMVAYCKDFTLVLDGDHAEVHRMDCTGDERWASYNRTWAFPDHGTAMIFALSVRGTEPDHILDLKAQAAAGRIVGSTVG